MQNQETKKRGRTPKNPITQEDTAIKETEQTEETTKTENTFTLEQVQKMIEEALAKREAEHTVNQAKSDRTVTMLFQDEVNDANVIYLGPNGKFGQITGKSATITIPYRDFIGEFRTTLVQQLLRSRNLIVVDGLTDEERRIYGLDYQEGEYLEPAVYERLIGMGDEILQIFPKLSVTWREMVAAKFADSYRDKTLKCSREVLLALNRISRQDYAELPKEDARRKGGFYEIIHQMNAAEEMDV